MTYENIIPDLLHIIEYWVKTNINTNAEISKQNLYNFLIRKCGWCHYDVNDPVQGIITCLDKFKKIYAVDDFMLCDNTYKYDIYDITVNIGEYIKWRNTWLHQYINDYPNDKYYTDIYYDTFKPIISIVIIPFEEYINITPYEINGFIYK